jgi:dihydropteroate synthase
MGILNLTPDSFSDGGQFHGTEEAVEHALRLVDEGADILDIGGESTRPYAASVNCAEELRRVVPVLEQLIKLTDVPLSIDTSRAEVASAALEIGVEIINDVTGLEGDPMMVQVAADQRAGLCVMHMQGTPQTMQDDPRYTDVVAEVHDHLQRRQRVLQESGIDAARICLDPGIGFGKTHQHNLTLLANCWRLHRLGSPILVGHSRKGFISKLLGDSPSSRVWGTIAIGIGLASQGVQILRVHDVAATQQTLRMYDASGGIDGQPLDLGSS